MVTRRASLRFRLLRKIMGGKEILTDKLKTDRNLLTRMEKLGHPPRVPLAKEIAMYLNVNVGEVYGDPKTVTPFTSQEEDELIKLLFVDDYKSEIHQNKIREIFGRDVKGDPNDPTP